MKYIVWKNIEQANNGLVEELNIKIKLIENEKKTYKSRAR